jgi:hypothetical protein
MSWDGLKGFFDFAFAIAAGDKIRFPVWYRYQTPDEGTI